MSKFRRMLMMANAVEPVPPTPVLPYDAEVEWLQNPVGAYIHLPYKPSNTIGYEVKWCKGDSDATLERAPIGCWTGWKSNMWGDDLKEVESKILCCWGANYNYISSVTYPANNFAVWKRVNNEFYYNGVKRSTNTAYTFQSTRDIYLFGINIGSVQYNNPMKIAYCKIFNSSNNSLIFDLIPVRKDGVGYMYDKISGVMYGNNGTGAFTFGNDVTT